MTGAPPRFFNPSVDQAIALLDECGDSLTVASEIVDRRLDAAFSQRSIRRWLEVGAILNPSEEPWLAN